MNACPAREHLLHLLAETLPASERSALETHVEHCTRCQETLEHLTENSLLIPIEPAAAPSGAALLELRDQPFRCAGPTHGADSHTSVASRTQELPPLGFLSRSDQQDSLGRLGHYDILEILGQGGFGIVLRAFDDALQRAVAIKILAPALTATPSARQRFLREARAAALVRHENVVQIYAIEEQPLPYLVMELIPGETLQQRLDRKAPFVSTEVVTIGRQIAEALAAAHVAGLIHRDVKPANVLIEQGQRLRVKVTDFGLARAVDDTSITQSGVVAGTPMYMSPEQAEGEALDPRSDLFSLGSVLYALVSGLPPFRAGTTLAVLKRVALDGARPIAELNRNTPRWLCDLIAKLHAKDRADRFQTASEVATLLAQGEAGGTPTIPASSRHPTNSRWLRWVAAGVVGLAAVGVIAFALNRPGADTHNSNPGGIIASPPGPNPYRNALGMEFVRIPKGRFWMGGSSGEPGKEEVEIPYDFYLGKYEVTQEEWEKVMGNNPSGFSRAGSSQGEVKDIPDSELKRFPVEMVNWNEARLFMERLNGQEPDPSWRYRLPWEREWEYACRGGAMADRSESTFNYYFDRPTNELRPNLANYLNDKGLGRTCRVGSYLPNRLGLYDMHGNVNEWCADIVEEADHPAARVHRGGCWEFEDSECVARRPDTSLLPPVLRHNSLGLRVARVPRGAD